MERASEPADGLSTGPVTGAGGVLVPPGRETAQAAGQPDVGLRDVEPGAGVPPRGEVPGRRRLGEGQLITVLFLGPALIALVVLVAYPIVYTVWLSVRSSDGARFVGADNYIRMFTSPETRRAITNNVIWMVVAPSVVTAIGLVFAVLTERVRMATAFKTVLFMPMAISFVAAGVTFRLVYDENPERGALNAAVVTIHDAFKPPSKYSGANPRDNAGAVVVGGAVQTANPVAAGQPALIPLVGLPPDRLPANAADAVIPSGPGLHGVVWLDFTRGGGGKSGALDPGEKGLPGIKVEAVRDGKVVETTQTDTAGRFAFDKLTGDGYTVRLAAANFAPPFRGLTWLGPRLVTPSIIGAYVWIWAGFAMVLIAAGLAAIPREALEAARVDGATEWQVFRRVTIPLVRPVLVVVLVTLVINVLKIFDLVLVLAPEASQDDANVVALEMYRVSFGGGLDYGLGSALGVLLFVLVLPAMLFNIRKLRREE
jgi:alpha-glucoside transport system permease protein